MHDCCLFLCLFVFKKGNGYHLMFGFCSKNEGNFISLFSSLQRHAFWKGIGETENLLNSER